MTGMSEQAAARIHPRTVPGRDGLAALLADPARALVGLDFDGTLAPIVTDPADSRLAPGGLQVLRHVAARVGTLAIVTGRPAAEVVALGGLEAVPGLIVEGQYGAERWEAGRLRVPAAPPGVAAVRAELPEVLTSAARGVWTEDKGLALVVHTRPAADPDAALAAIQAPVTALARRHGLHAHPGRYVLEIRAGDQDKGNALRRLAAERHPTAILFAGDDIGDLPAFAAIDDLRATGTPGLTIGSWSAEAPAVADRADLSVPGPAAVLTLLATIFGLTPDR
jgi:trehalose 6-phosphate phosphatase